MSIMYSLADKKTLSASKTWAHAPSNKHLTDLRPSAISTAKATTDEAKSHLPHRH